MATQRTRSTKGFDRRKAYKAARLKKAKQHSKSNRKTRTKLREIAFEQGAMPKHHLQNPERVLTRPTNGD